MMKQNDYGVPLTHDTQRWVSLMTILGALTGQIMFGVLGDSFGRKWTFISTAVLTIFGTILQAAAQPRMMGLNIWQQVGRYDGFCGPRPCDNADASNLTAPFPRHTRTHS